MKHLIFIGLLFGAVSCSTVHFMEVQPMNGERLHELPEELQGTWYGDDSVSYIRHYPTYSEDFSVHRDSLGNIVDTTIRYTYLSDSLRLYKGGDYYVYNDRFTNGTWRIMVVKTRKNGDIDHYYIDDPIFYSKLKGLNIDSAETIAYLYIEEIDDIAGVDTVLVNPTIKQLESDEFSNVQNAYIGGQIRIKDLKKIAKRKYLFYTYKADGTIYAPEPDIEQVEGPSEAEEKYWEMHMHAERKITETEGD